jgi:IS4 transposase
VFGRIAALLMHESRQRVRELRYTIPHDGFRTKRVTLVTARLEPRKYSARELAELYGARRPLETNLKHLKQTMGMDVLRSKSPDGVLKDLWVSLIVYNQVRLFMLDAAERRGVPPDRLSFIGVQP